MPIALMDPLAPKDCGPSLPEAVYPGIPTGFAAVQAHTKGNKYSFFIRDIQPNKGNLTKVIYACDRARRSQSKAKNLEIGGISRVAQSSTQQDPFS